MDDDQTLESATANTGAVSGVWTYDKHIGGGGANVILMTRIYQRVPLINVGCQPHAAHSRPQPRGDTSRRIRKTFLSARDPLSIQLPTGLSQCPEKMSAC